MLGRNLNWIHQSKCPLWVPIMNLMSLYSQWQSNDLSAFRVHFLNLLSQLLCHTLCRCSHLFWLPKKKWGRGSTVGCLSLDQSRTHFIDQCPPCSTDNRCGPEYGDAACSSQVTLIEYPLSQFCHMPSLYRRQTHARPRLGIFLQPNTYFCILPLNK